MIERAPRSPTGIAPVILGAGRCGFFGRYLREVGAAFYLLLNGIGGTLIGDDDLPVVDGFRNRWDFCRKFVLELLLESRCLRHVTVLAFRNVRSFQLFLKARVKIGGVRLNAQESRDLCLNLIVCSRLPLLLRKTKDNRFFDQFV